MSGAPFVVVIGPPGVGKSTVAAALAQRLGRRLVDTDALVEERPAAVETEPDPLELLGLAPAPFDVDAT